MDINPAFRRLCFIIGTWFLILAGLPVPNLPPLSFAAEIKTPPDTLILINGDQLTGQLERMDGATVFFKTDSVGKVKTTWDKVRELHSVRIFAVIEKPGKGTSDLS